MPRFLRRLPALVCLVVTCAVTAPAIADEQSEAREEFKKAETAYAVREFSTAVEHYKKAYELSKKPALLFNIAQALKQNGDFRESIHFYETYLRLSPDAPNRSDVERYLEESRKKAVEKERREAELQRLEAERRKIEDERKRVEAERLRLEAEAEARRAQEREAKAKAELARARKQGTRQPNPALKLTGLITIGASLALVGGGIYFGLEAESDFDTVNSAQRWSPELDDTRESAESARTWAIVLSSVGGAGAVTGAVLYFLGRRGRVVEASPVAVVPISGGAWFGYSGYF